MIRAHAYQIPTDGREGDGTLEWDSTSLVVAEADGGLGYTYAHPAAAELINDKLADALEAADLDEIGGCWMTMRRALRQAGSGGLAAMAISAVDIALWDRFARARDMSLSVALGAFRDTVAVYGSGGFTTYDDAQLREQLRRWTEAGIPRVKIKVGADALADRLRVAVAREAIGPSTELFVDANGAWGRREAVRRAWELDEAGAGIAWLEEPVSSEDPAGLRFVREHAPSAMAVAAGEYIWSPADTHALLRAKAVDVLQLDATRCLGLTGFRAAAAQAAARGVAVSGHCAPALHLHAGCATERFAHLEYFHDHVRIEAMLFDGAPEPADGELSVRGERAGHGLSFRAEAAAPFAVGA